MELAPKTNSRTRRIPGISAAAKALGVHRLHLRLVLQGKRKSSDLVQRYAAWRIARFELCGSRRRKMKAPRRPHENK